MKYAYFVNRVDIWKTTLRPVDVWWPLLSGMHGAELLGHGTGVKVCGAGRGGVGQGKNSRGGARRGKKVRSSTDFCRLRQIFIGQNWILPCNCLPNFNGLKSTLPRCAPQVLVIFTGRGKASFLWGGAGRGVHPWWAPLPQGARSHWDEWHFDQVVKLEEYEKEVVAVNHINWSLFLKIS